MSEDDERIKGGGYDLPLLGIGFQQPVNPVEKNAKLEYGFELTAIGSWENDVRVAEISSGPSGGKVVVKFDNRWFLGDLAWGGYASYTVWKRLRVYAGIGPLFVYGRRHVKPAENGSDNLEETIEEGGGLGGYVRTGIDFRLTERYLLGACVRGMTTNLSFDDDIGKVRVEGIQGMAILTIQY